MESFISEIVETGLWQGEASAWGVSSQATSELFSLAQKLHSEKLFQPARVGKGITKTLASGIRRDEIHWLTEWQLSPLPMIAGLFREIQSLSRRELFLPVKRFEAHLSVYPSGAFYKTHVDRHRRLPSRLLSLVLYLNDMGEEGGGELKLYPKGRDEVVVHPQAGRMVIFDSRLRHEVCVTHQERWSLTCWFRSDEIVGIEGL